MAIKALIFDNFGVLMSEVYSALRHALPDQARGQLLQILDAADNGQITAAEQRQQLIALLTSYHLDGVEEIARVIQESRRNTRLFDFILASRQHYLTAMLSNVSAAIWNYYTPEELNKYFDQVILSYQEGIAKPDPRIYQLACQRLGVQPNECVFTDDNPVNVAAADKVGMHGIIFTSTDDYLAKLQDILHA